MARGRPGGTVRINKGAIMQRILVHCTATKDDHIPEYQSIYASGADLKADIPNSVILEPLQRLIVPTGLAFQIPEGYEAQVRPRSGLAFKSGLTVLNTPGTIDSDYRGEVKVILINLGNEPITISPGDRIAQVIFAPVVHAQFVQTETLAASNRGEGGFGSTGQ